MKRFLVDEQVAARLRDLRHRRRLSARELAEECARAGAPSLTRVAISKVESRGRSLTDAELTVLAGLLGVSRAEILGPPPGQDAPPGQEAARGQAAAPGSVHNAEPSPHAIDFFISYSPADELWASWIAWELESAGYRTMLQAWDFIPSTNFTEFMDRGLSEAAAVVAVFSRSYLSTHGDRMEWQAVRRSEAVLPSPRLVPVRVQDCELGGLPARVACVDLVGITDPDRARAMLLDRVGRTLDGPARLTRRPPYPSSPDFLDPPDGGVPGSGHEAPLASLRPSVRRTPAVAPDYPPTVLAGGAPRTSLTILHVSAPRLGVAANGRRATDHQARTWAEVVRLTNAGAPPPDLIVVTGDLTESGGAREFDEASIFLTGLRVLFGMGPERVVVVPGGHDVNSAASRAYFASCEADDVAPQPPYWPKWRHYIRLFRDFYQGTELVFDVGQPWSLFTVPELKLVVAGLNSTIAYTHRDEDRYGLLGDEQAAWFAQQLGSYEQAGWFRLGAVAHPPRPPDVDEDAAAAGGFLTDDAASGLLDPHLNLIIHGGYGGGERQNGPENARARESLHGIDRSGAADSGVTIRPDGMGVVPPASGSVRTQLLQIRPDGVVRWAADGRARADSGSLPGARAVRSAPTPGRWRTAGATFVSEPARGSRDAGSALPMRPAPDPERLSDPTMVLLDRITEVCRMRHEQVRVRTVPGPFPHVFATYQADGFVRQSQIGAFVGTVAIDVIEDFIQKVHAGDPTNVSELVYQGPPVSPSLRDGALRRGVRVRSFTEFQGLLDLREFVANQTRRLRGAQQYLPELYVTQRYRELIGSGGSVQENLTDHVTELLLADEGRFIAVLGDFGTGKTFALREIARRLADIPHLTPIYIELRTLDKAHSVEGLVAAHLANNGSELIDLKAFRYLLREGRIILLFDGFDELVTRVTYDRAADHLARLLAAADGRAKIVVASRTQHFRSNDQVLSALGETVGLLPHRRMLSIEHFGVGQIHRYLLNRYHGDFAQADRRFEQIGKIADLLGLAANPRMLSFVADLDDAQLHAVLSAGGAISAARLYQEILHTWLSFEEERTQGIAGAPPGLTLDGLWRAVTLLALRLWELGESALRLAELSEIAEVLSGLTAGRLSTPQTVHAIGAGSLLVRTEDGMFGFIHGSVVEWLVAHEIARRLEAADDTVDLLGRQLLTTLAVDFLCDLTEIEKISRWTTGVLGRQDADDVSRTNALRLSARLRSMAKADLRGASLRGEDLSSRHLRSADFSGADLTDTRLVDTDLTEATLADAQLVGARLDGAVLAGADLRNANLDHARLIRTDLRGVDIAGSTWRRAALIATPGAEAIAGRPELRGAAVAPGQPVEFGLAPAEVGVGFGFAVGQLPHPITYSENGDLVAVGTNDGSVVVCDGETGRVVRVLEGHRGRVYAVHSRDGLLATGESDTVRLWDLATGRALQTLRQHERWVWPVELSPDSQRIAVGDASGVLRLWDVSTGSELHRLAGHAERVWTAAFTPDSAVLATGDDGGVVRIWDATTGRLRHVIDHPADSVYRLGFSPAGDLLATSDNRGVVRLWDPVDGRLRRELVGHTHSVYTLDFDPSGRLLATGDTRGSVRLWDLGDGGRGRALTQQTGAVYRVLFSPDGQLLATGDSDGTVELWDVTEGIRRHRIVGHRGSVWPMVFRPDGRAFATSSNDGTTALWDVASGERRHALRGHGRRLMSVRFSTSGTELATSGNDGRVRLWDPTAGRLVRELAGDHTVTGISAPIDRHLAAAAEDGSVQLWNTETGAYERRLNTETDKVWAIALSADGELVATADDEDSVRLWYRTTGRLVRTLPALGGRVRTIAFSSDGKRIATGCDDRTVRLWDPNTGEMTANLTGHTDRIFDVRFDADASLLVSASNDGTARLWDLRRADHPAQVIRHPGRLWAAGFSPDGTQLATAGDDLVIRLWDVASCRRLHTLSGHSRRVWSVDYSPDGRLLASCGDDGTVRIWQLDSPTPRLQLILVGLADGWAALTPDGRYKTSGVMAGEIWHVVGMCRFELGELDAHLDSVRRVPDDEPLLDVR